MEALSEMVRSPRAGTAWEANNLLYTTCMTHGPAYCIDFDRALVLAQGTRSALS